MLLFLASGAALGALLGRSWPLLALSWRLLGRAWPSRGAPGSHFRHPGASFGTCLGLFFRRLWKNTKTLIFDDSCSENQGFGVPGGSKIEPRWLPNRSWARLGASWRSLGASRRCLGVSWRPLGALGGLLGASWGALEAILAQKGNLAIVEREARSKRELQARQERQEQREQQEQGEPERQHHEKEQCKSGKTSKSLQTAIQYDRLCPCSAATRPRRAWCPLLGR